MEKSVRDGLEQRAKRLGFDSAQAYIRVWAKAEIENRELDFGEPELMTPKMEQHIEQAEKEIAAGETVGPFDSVDTFLRALHKMPPTNED